MQTRQFSKPYRQAFTMILILLLFSGGVYLLWPGLEPIITASPILNGVITLVFIVGILACFWQVFQLTRAVRWIIHYSNSETSPGTAPRLLAPLALLMRGDRLPRNMSTASTQSILDSVAVRIDEIRDITRHIINLLIFLGLLGTFYGLATTVPAVVDTIRSLRPADGESATQVFDNLMLGLEGQLGGMGTAFGSSLLGLTGSLVVGLLDLFASHGQNRFYREFEEWLSSFTSVGVTDANGQRKLGDFVEASDDIGPALNQLAQSIARLDNRIAEQGVVVNGIFEVLSAQHETETRQRGEGIRHAQAIENALYRLIEDGASGRESNQNELRRDLSAIRTSLDRLNKTAGGE